MVMNRSEKICFEWIKEQGYSEDEIFYQQTKTPDFICKNGKRFEAKRLYGDQILIYDRQIKNLKNVIIVVVNLSENKVTTDFKWENKEEIKYPKIKIIKITHTNIPITEKVGEILKQRKREAEAKTKKDITWDEFLLEATHGG